ncbi:MAG: tetratricopeptide repeat protein [Bacteroidetes bacterium]|nr:tetratricopeptide repeat protein [Bacteroidota bacterium]
MVIEEETKDIEEQLTRLAPGTEARMLALLKLEVLCTTRGDIAAALNYTTEAEEIARSIGSEEHVTVLLVHKANQLKILGDSSGALKSYFEGLELAEKRKDKKLQARLLYSMSDIHVTLGDSERGLKNCETAKQLFEEIGDDEGIILSELGMLGALLHLKRAVDFHKITAHLQQRIDDNTTLSPSRKTDFKGVIQQQLATYYHSTGELDKALLSFKKCLELFKSINDHRVPIIYLSIGNILKEQGNLNEALQWLNDPLLENCPYREAQVERYNYISYIYEQLNDTHHALKYYKLFHEQVEEINANDMKRQIDAAMYKKEIEAERRRKEEVEREKKRADELLYNILPEEVALELKQKGTAGARHFDDVTVFFSDFKNFTTISEKLTPQQLVDELHECFSAFDNIMHKYNIEKIKTVGDAYLAVSGLPVANPNHAVDIINAAIEIQQFMKERSNRRGNTEGLYQMRVGINSGSVVAGIVGIKKFAYDIWGDTVNTAARMEQNSEAGKINISQTTYQLVKDKFNCAYRGEIEAKNKGKMKMYFVEFS